MTRTRTFTTDTPDPRKPVPAPRRHPVLDLRVDVHNHAPPAKAAPGRRVNVDHIATKLAAITKAVLAIPAKKAAVEAVDVQQRHDATPARLAEMNKRNREYWHK
jgi:hypothetical protein